jgi:hypothetical protein
MISENPIKLLSMLVKKFQEIQHDSFCPAHGVPYCILKRIVDYASFVKQFTGNTIRLAEIAIFWSLTLKVLESEAQTNISRYTRGNYSND